MKVAIEFYGHLRTFREAAPSILKHFVSLYENPDIFIHTWDQSDHSNITWHNLSGEIRGSSLAEGDIDFLEKNYHPRKLLIEPQISFSEEGNFVMLMTENKAPLSMITNVFYTKWKSNELRKDYQKETGIKYDFVIQTRLDLYFKKDFRIEDFIDYRTLIKKTPLSVDLSKKFFYASDHWIETYKVNDLLYAGGSDVLYFGAPEVIDKAVSVYTHIDRFDLNRSYYSNEYLMLINAMNMGLEPVEIYFRKDRDFGVLRTQETLKYLADLHDAAPNAKPQDDAKTDQRHKLRQYVFYYTSPFTQNIIRKLLRLLRAAYRKG